MHKPVGSRFQNRATLLFVNLLFQDPVLFDYEYDSDEDWEDEGEGESLSDAEDEKEIHYL